MRSNQTFMKLNHNCYISVFDSAFDHSQHLVCFIASIMTVSSYFKVTANDQDPCARSLNSITVHS